MNDVGVVAPPARPQPLFDPIINRIIDLHHLAKEHDFALRMSEAFLHHAYGAVCYASSNISFCRYLLRCEAEQNRMADKPIQTNIADLLNDPSAHPGRKFLILNCEEMVNHVGVDCLITGGDLSIIRDRKHRQWMNDALQTGFERSKDSIRATANQLYGEELCPTMLFQTVASETEPCLWLSDWIAWEVPGTLNRRGALCFSLSLRRSRPSVASRAAP